MMHEFFFNCDWGTSRFRLRLINAATGNIVDEKTSDDGVLTITAITPESREQLFRQILDRQVRALVEEVGPSARTAPILISGMASSSIGWRNLPYARLPFSLNGGDLSFVQIEDPDRQIFLFSGLSSDCDVMRGEEMELIGLGMLSPETFQQHETVWSVLPGTHSKHVKIERGIVVEFHTYLTGELYHLLSRHSSLRHSAGEMTFARSGADQEHWQKPFLKGVARATQRDLSGNLFQVRAQQLLQGDDPVQSAAFLSGMLIGGELETLLCQRTGSEPIMLAASLEFSELYRLAIVELGAGHRLIEISPTNVARLSALGQLQAGRRIQTNMN